jgi:hypothetical protein
LDGAKALALFQGWYGEPAGSVANNLFDMVRTSYTTDELFKFIFLEPKKFVSIPSWMNYNEMFTMFKKAIQGEVYEVRID